MPFPIDWHLEREAEELASARRTRKVKHAFRKEVIEYICAVLFILGFMLITAQWAFAAPCQFVTKPDGRTVMCCPVAGGVHCS